MSVTTNILGRTFRIRYRESTGTCFTVYVEGKRYLITAKHVVKAVRDDESVEIVHDGNWKSVQVKLVGHGAGAVDVSVLAPQVIFGADYKLTLTMDGVIFGEDLYFLGFPYGLGMEGETDFNANFPVPLLKKAVISGSKEDGTIFLDGHNNPGFSGGPVARRGTKEEQAVIGVVSGYRYDTHHVLDERGNKAPYTYSTNTGIVIAHNINQALEIIEKNPIGERVDQGLGAPVSPRQWPRRRRHGGARPDRRACWRAARAAEPRGRMRADAPRGGT